MPDVLIEEKVIDNSIEGDFLNRQDFIQQVKTVIELLSANKKNSCFAISGTWGIGKSYVLEKLEKQLLFEQNEATALDKYFVFHFNCWEYDYYEEPLIAIVSSMLDDINTKEHLFTETAREHILSAAKFVLSKLYEGGSKWLESKIGVNLKDITDELSEIHSDATTKIEDANKYDEYLDFKQALSTLREELKEIVSERTVIFVVDELDRCIPEYQIKVLERLHHIFNDIENMQVILAVDKAQLERTIQKMFGDNVDTQKYLAKFINFEIELDEGTYNRRFEEMFDFYFNQFDGNDDPDIIEFKSNIFVGIATREKIEIVEKCHLLHNLLDEGDERKHATFMCVELFLTIIRHTKAKLPHKPQGLYFGGMFGDKSTNGLNFIEEKMGRTIDYGDERGTRAYYYVENNGRRYLLPKDLWGILLGCYATITESQLHGVSENRETMATIKEYTKQFWTLLKTIK